MLLRTTPAQRHHVRRLHALATPPPWKYTPGVGVKHYVHSTDVPEDFGVGLQEFHWQDGHEVPAAANAEIIAVARNTAPDACTDVDALLGTLGIMEVQINRELAAPAGDPRALCVALLTRIRAVLDGQFGEDTDGEDHED